MLTGVEVDADRENLRAKLKEVDREVDNEVDNEVENEEITYIPSLLADTDPLALEGIVMSGDVAI